MELRNGPIVKDEALVLAVSLEARGHALKLESGVLKVSDGTRLSETDRADIKRLRNHLLAIVDYQP